MPSKCCGGLVELVLCLRAPRGACAREGSPPAACDKRLEGARGLKRLIENLLAVDAGDLHGDGQVEAIVQRLDGLNGVA